jgi:hypothetical protein
MNRLFDVNVSQSMRLSLIARVHLEPAAVGISPSPGCHPDCRNESRWSVAEDGPERLRASIGFYPGQVGDVSVAHGTSSLLVYALSSTHCDAFASPPSRATFSFVSPPLSLSPAPRLESFDDAAFGSPMLRGGLCPRQTGLVRGPKASCTPPAPAADRII